MFTLLPPSGNFPSPRNTPSNASARFSGKRGGWRKTWDATEQFHLLLKSGNNRLIDSAEQNLRTTASQYFPDSASQGKKERVIDELIKTVRDSRNKNIAGGDDAIKVPEYWDQANVPSRSPSRGAESPSSGNSLSQSGQLSLRQKQKRPVTRSEPVSPGIAPLGRTASSQGSRSPKRLKQGQGIASNPSSGHHSPRHTEPLEGIQQVSQPYPYESPSPFKGLYSRPSSRGSWRNESPTLNIFQPSKSSSKSSRRSSASGISDIDVDMDDLLVPPPLGSKIGRDFGTVTEQEKQKSLAAINEANAKRAQQKKHAATLKTKLLQINQNHQATMRINFTDRNLGVDANSVAEKLSELKLDSGKYPLNHIPAYVAAEKLPTPMSPLSSPGSNTPSHSPSERSSASASPQGSGYVTPTESTLRRRTLDLQELGEKLRASAKKLPTGDDKNILNSVARQLLDPKKQYVLSRIIDSPQTLEQNIARFNSKHNAGWTKNNFAVVASHIHRNTDMRIGPKPNEDCTQYHKEFIKKYKGRNNIDQSILIEEWNQKWNMGAIPQKPLAKTGLQLMLGKYNKKAPPHLQIGNKVYTGQGAENLVHKAPHSENVDARQFLNRADIQAMGNQHREKLKKYREETGSEVKANTFLNWAKQEYKKSK